MKVFLKIVGVLLFLIIVVGLVLDNSVNVTRSVNIAAAPQAIHPYVNDLTKWPEWTPWNAMDPSMKTKFGETTSGVGASQSWQGESGAGQLTIIQSDRQQGITFKMTFNGDPTEFKSHIRYEWDGKVTKVSWTMEGEMQPIIIGNYFAQLMDLFVGPSYEEGLNNLKKIVEDQV